MVNKDFFIKNKIINQHMIDGKKVLCEQFFLKNCKILQKTTTKNHEYILKLAIVNAASVILTKKIEIKNRKKIKEFPFLVNKKNRVALSIKSIMRSLKMCSENYRIKTLSSELLLNAQNKSFVSKEKKDTQKKALIKKKYTFFRWFC